MNTKISLNDLPGSQLKEYRIQNHIKNKDVAANIGKSPAYISKLEMGQIRQIDKSELIKITNFISGTDDGYFQFCEKIAGSAKAEEFEHNIFLLNFDTLERQIPVNPKVIHELQSRMKSLNISSVNLTNYINKNEDLGEDFFTDHKIDKNTVERNTWIHYPEADSSEMNRCFILLDYQKKRIEKLINGEIHKCEYMLPFAVLYHLIKLSHKKDEENLNEKLIKKCLNETEQILLNDGFYSLGIQARLTAQSNTQTEYENLLNSFDMKSADYIRRILRTLQLLSAIDAEYANEKLKTIADNFNGKDPSFFLAYMAQPLSEIEDLQTSLKKEFLNELDKLIKKYSSLLGTKANIEKY